jgi:Fic family protein
LNRAEPDARSEKLRLEWTYTSNAIEGNSLTLGETAFYLREGLTSEGKPLIDYLEAKNHAEAIDWLFEVVRNKKSITEGFIKDLNALLHKGITERPARGAGGSIIMRKITPGVYKREPNHVLTLSGEIHYYVEPLQVPAEMEKLVHTINEQEGTMHPVELASTVNYEITHIHPFDDCNGRVARILLNLIFMRAEYPPIVIKMKERRAYLEALEKADKGDRESFYLFVAEHVKQSLKEE